jgi:anti-anti-sigma factor
VDLKISREDGRVLAQTLGPIDHTAREAFGAELHALVSQPGTLVVLDLSGSSSITSFGLGDLMALVACANMNSSRVVLSACSPFVTMVLERSGLADFVERLGRTAKPKRPELQVA